MVDSSSAVGASGFLKIKEFIKTITPYFNAGQAQHAFVDFTDTAKTSIPLSRRNDVTLSRDFSTALDEIKFRGGDAISRISEGLGRANIELRNADVSSSKYVVLITSSDPRDDEMSTLLFVKDEIQANGAKLLVVGVGDAVDENTLKQISTDGQIYRPENFDDLVGSVQSLRETVCKKA